HDPNSGPISYLMDSGPAGMSIDPVSGLLAWTPTAASPAQASVIVEAYNVRGGHAAQRFTIAVSGVNQPPVFDALAAQFSGQEGQPLEIAVHATDPEGDPLVYWADNLPAGAVFDTQTQTLTWVPDARQAGTYPNVQFFVSDGLHSVRVVTTLLIAPTNFQPTLVPPPDRTVLEGGALHFPLPGSDPHGDPLTS